MKADRKPNLVTVQKPESRQPDNIKSPSFSRPASMRSGICKNLAHNPLQRKPELPAAALALCTLLLFVITGCNTKPAPPQAANQAKQQQPVPAAPPAQTPGVVPAEGVTAAAQGG